MMKPSNQLPLQDATTAPETPSAAIARLQKEIKDNPHQPSTTPSALALRDIHSEEVVFQVRGEDVDAERVRKIALGLSWDKTDDPLHVWWTGCRWALFEGHHRLAAYRLSKKNPKGTRKVPVIAHAGMTLQVAMGLASITNSREKVTIPQWRRLDQAWRLTCISAGSVASLARDSGCGKSTIGNMRAGKAELLERKWMTVESLPDVGWVTAREWLKGNERPEWTLEADEAKSIEIADFLMNNLNGYLVRRPATFARALSLVSENFPYALMQTDCWSDALKNIFEGREGDDEGDEEECGF